MLIGFRWLTTGSIFRFLWKQCWYFGLRNRCGVSLSTKRLLNYEGCCSVKLVMQLFFTARSCEHLISITEVHLLYKWVFSFISEQGRRSEHKIWGWGLRFTVKMSVLDFWVLMLCGLYGRCQHFGKAYCLHLQGCIFLRSVGVYQHVNTALLSRNSKSACGKEHLLNNSC